MKNSIENISKKRFIWTVVGATLFSLSTLSANADVRGTEYQPINWNIGENVNGKVNGYIQADAYSMDRGDADFGTGAIDRSDFATTIRRAYIVLHGDVYDWSYLVVYDFSTDKPKGNNGLIWAGLEHDVGPGKLFLGQHWNYSALEEGVSSGKLMFMERNFVSSYGLTGLRNHAQGAFYQISEPYGEGDNNMFFAVSGYSLNNTLSDRSNDSGYGFNTALEWAPVVENRRWVQFGGGVTYNKATSPYGLSSVAPGYAGTDSPVQVVSGFTPTNESDRPELKQFNLNAMGTYESFFLMGEYGRGRFTQSQQHSNTVEAYSVQAGIWLTGEATPFDSGLASYGTPQPLHKYGAVQLVVGYDSIKNNGVDSAHPGGVASGGALNPGTACFPVETDSGFSPSDISECHISRYRLGVNYWMNPLVRISGLVTKSKVDLGDAGEDDPTIVTARLQLLF